MENLLKILEYISPADCDYQEWINVGMALKHEGYRAEDWDEWSRSDSRYHNGECIISGSHLTAAVNLLLPEQ